MTTLTRKQREVANREELILDVARKMLGDDGYAGLSMDRIAEVTEYSKGVIYQHFKSKEDLIVELAAISQRQRAERFERAIGFEGRPRERMMAIGIAEELFVRLNPLHFHTEQIIKMGALYERASNERVSKLQQEVAQCFQKLIGVVADGVRETDLKLPPRVQPSDIVLGLWGVNYGIYTIMHTEQKLLTEHGVVTPFETVRESCHRMLDGYGWRPLSTEWDYEQTYRRILRDIFPEESIKAGLG